MAETLVTPRTLDPSTKEGAEQHLKSIKRLLGYADRDCRPLAHLLVELRQVGGFARFVKGDATWERFCKETLNTDPKFLDAIVAGVDELERQGWRGAAAWDSVTRAVVKIGKHGGQRPNAGRKGKAKNQVEALHLIKKKAGSHTKAYILGRLERDRPELAEQVRLGELSAARAAIRAGFEIHKVKVVKSAEGFAAAALRHLDEAQRDELISRLMAGKSPNGRKGRGT